MHLLPTNLAPIANVAAKDEGKYAMRGVQLALGEKEYTVAATDGRRLLVVTGPYTASLDDYPLPEIAPIRTAPNGATTALVPADAWQKTFKAADKLTRRTPFARSKPIYQNVAVALSPNQSSFYSHDGEQSAFEQPTNVEGRFPPYRDVIPKKAPIITQRVDPAYLSSMLDAARAFTDDEAKGVDIEIHRNGHFILKCGNNRGQTVTGLVVGLGEPTVGVIPRDAAEKASVAVDASLIEENKALVKQLEDRDMTIVALRAERVGLPELTAPPPAAESTADETGGAKVKRLRKELAEVKKRADAAEKRAEERFVDMCKANNQIEQMLKAQNDNGGTVEVEQLRRQVATLQAINANLARERGLVGK